MADVGYIRVSCHEQNTARQLDGVKLDKLFTDKESGGNTKREGLSRCLDYIREGDVLHVHSIDRLARNLLDLQRLVEELTGKGITIQFHQENLVFSGSNSGILSPLQTLLFQVLGAFAQFERACIRERQKEGLARCKAAGKRLGRPAKLSNEIRGQILAELNAGSMPSLLAQKYGISVSSVYKLRAKSQGRI